MRREPASNTSRERGPAQLPAHGGRRPRPPTSRSVDHTEQRADGQLDPAGNPRSEMITPRPGIHPDLPALIALPSAYENRPPPRIKIRLDQRQRFLDPKPTTPQHHDQRPQPEPVTIGRRLAHHGDDLVDRRRIGRIDHPLVPGRAPGVVARHRCRRASPTGGVEQQLSRRHRSLPSRVSS